jgi:hypothetical protein
MDPQALARQLTIGLAVRRGPSQLSTSAIHEASNSDYTVQEVMLMTDLFDIIAAKSAGDYGCEIWSTPWLGDW